MPQNHLSVWQSATKLETKVFFITFTPAKSSQEHPESNSAFITAKAYSFQGQIVCELNFKYGIHLFYSVLNHTGCMSQLKNADMS